MFLDQLTIEVDECVCLWTMHPVFLIVGEETIAVDAPIKHVMFFFKEIL